MENHKENFFDTLEAKDYIKAYRDMEFLFVEGEEDKALEVANFLQKHCQGVQFWIGKVTRFEEKLYEYIKDRKSELNSIAVQIGVNRRTLTNLINKYEKVNQ